MFAWSQLAFSADSIKTQLSHLKTFPNVIFLAIYDTFFI
jgi:hypothetical protein